MKRTGVYFPFQLILMLAWLLMVLLLTMLPERFPLVHYSARIFSLTGPGAIIGHAGLFGILTAIAYWTLTQWLHKRYAYLLAISGTLLLGTMTELYQNVVISRAATEVDMLANWFGILMVAVVITHFETAKDS